MFNIGGRIVMDENNGRIRGPEGPKGPEGLSAYGVWLAEGNVGTAEDFLASLKIGGRFALAMHTGGQQVPQGGQVQLLPRASRGIECEGGGLKITSPGGYFIRYFAAADYGTFAIKINGFEAPGTRFTAQGAAFAVTAIEVAEAPAEVQLFNASTRGLRLLGNRGAVDAYIHITAID